MRRREDREAIERLDEAILHFDTIIRRYDETHLPHKRVERRLDRFINHDRRFQSDKKD